MVFAVSGFISILLLIEIVKQRIKKEIQCRSDQKVERGEIKAENGDGKTLPIVE